MSLIVKDFVGISLSTKEITFGVIMPGGSSNVDIFLDNQYNKGLRVLLMPEGNIAKFVKFSNNNFILEKNETKKIKVNAFAPKNTEFGNYTGILKVVYYRI